MDDWTKEVYIATFESIITKAVTAKQNLKEHQFMNYEAVENDLNKVVQNFMEELRK